METQTFRLIVAVPDDLDMSWTARVTLPRTIADPMAYLAEAVRAIVRGWPADHDGREAAETGVFTWGDADAFIRPEEWAGHGIAFWVEPDLTATVDNDQALLGGPDLEDR